MSYARLEEHFRRYGHLCHVAEIMQWDEAVMMSMAGGGARADAMATLKGVMHGHLTAPAIAEWLAAAEGEVDNLDPWQAANLREIRRAYRRATVLPAALVERMTAACMRAEQAWRGLRPASDWQGFAPMLSEIVALKREEAARLSDALGVPVYDALLDQFEPGCQAQEVDRVFGQLKGVLPELIEGALAHQAGHAVIAPRGPFPVEAQKALADRLMAAIGFDTDRGRLDVSHHPFCGGVPSDVRITTRYDESDFISSLMGVLHEAGHGKYEQGLPRQYEGQPVGAARGMSAHEGQSLLQEMQVSRSREFLAFAATHIRAAFPDAVAAEPAAFELDNLYRLYTRVARSFIRVDADEVTYPAHIIVRYEIERPLIEGKLQVADIPDAWDAGMGTMLGLSTGDDHNNGCMQDVHWAAGLFGYFPTYTLGAMTAAQLFACARRDNGELPAQIASGDFTQLNAWLSERVWRQGSLLEGDALMRHATGEPLSASYLEAHLRSRYLAPA